ncbi:MAG: hypothetical protein M3348_02935 [Acidobacteriota bacterium]|nr:hypothetical protein [Acidobacteriota bacterium]
MTTKLKSRVARLERSIPGRELALASAGMLDDFDVDEYVRLLGQLYSTMPMHYIGSVARELSLRHRHDRMLRLAAREDRFGLRPPRRPLVPRLRLSPLTLDLIRRIRRAMLGDCRPFALPEKVCNVYAWAKKNKRTDICMRECVGCGYDVPPPEEPVINNGALLKMLGDLSRPITGLRPIGMTACPLCRSALAPDGQRPWSDRNREDVVDVHVWPDGEVSLLH